jgi:energy-coupling factor transporter ATP-binding protein EcfA2
MADNRLEKIDTSQTDSNSESVKIKKLKLNNFKFFYHDFNFDINGKNILLYGENGSGKSSIYKALELLTKEDFSDFETNKNIFAADSDEGLSVEFTFTDDTQISFEDNEAQIPDNYEFLNGLSIFRPFLDYKRLLKVHYSSDNGKSKINLYSMFRQLLKDYPVKGEKLNDINDVIKYFEELKNILHMDLIDEINRFLKIYFKADILLNSIDTRTEFDLETDKALPIVNLNMDYYGNQV